MKLTEGETHLFRVIKFANLPDEGDYFVLRHESGRRILLSAQVYKNYGIKIGQSIRCRVDKVSCTGKVYLEPEHPVYKVGNEYEFAVVDCRRESPNDSHFTLTVADCFHNQIRVLVSEMVNPNNSRKVLLRVTSIKKGIPIAIDTAFKQIPSDLSPIIGKNLFFTVLGMGRDDNDEVVYSLAEHSGLRAELKEKHFNRYGFKTGEVIECTIIGETRRGLIKVEPINPFYKKGGVYNFEIVEDNVRLYEQHGDDYTLVVMDLTGKKCGVQVDKATYNKYKKKPGIACRVIGFRKGKPMLEFAQSDAD
ncbi:MAG TPA: hypothetical protein PKL52_04485 [Tenuifilaceae bacterium]|nr:hypothetical protein [Tenuifilaceae bacterium]